MNTCAGTFGQTDILTQRKANSHVSYAVSPSPSAVQVKPSCEQTRYRRVHVVHQDPRASGRTHHTQKSSVEKRDAKGAQRILKPE